MSADPDRRRLPEDLGFRSLAAPGLEEDDLFAALHGLSGAVLWGDGRPPAVGSDRAWDQDAERRRRHEALLEKWQPGPPGPREPPRR